MDLGRVAAVDVVNDAARGEFGEALQVRVPFAFGVEQDLVALVPERLDDGLQRGPVDGLEVLAWR